MKLLPCPFCGGPAVLRADGSTPDLPHYVRCDNLLCCGFNTSQGFRTPEIAATAWNERPIFDAIKRASKRIANTSETLAFSHDSMFAEDVERVFLEELRLN